MSFHFETHPGFLLVKTDEKYLDDRLAQALDKAVRERNDKLPLVIFDFLSLSDIHPQALKTLSRMLSGFSQNEVKSAFVVRHNVNRFITTSGMDRIIRCFESFEDIIPKTVQQPGDKAKTLEFLNTTLDAAIYTFKVATNTVVTHLKPFMRTQENVPTYDIAAMVGLVSAHFHGNLILAIPTETYIPIMNRLTGGTATEMTPEIRDGVCELLNIIIGQAKANLNQKGFQIKQAIPTLLTGGSFSAAGDGKLRSVIIPFESDAGKFFIELTTNTDRFLSDPAHTDPAHTDKPPSQNKAS
jgi:chemotaxis protein CheX